MFDKRKEFSMIDDKLKEIRIYCNRLQIPFIWVAAVYDNGNETEYRVAVDENNQIEDVEEKPYICQGLTPGSLGISLTDDKIRDIIKVLNGFKVVNSENPLPFDIGDFAVNAAAKAGQLYGKDEDGLFLDNTSEDETESSIVIQGVPTVQQPVKTPVITQPFIKERNVRSKVLHIGKNTDLPYIASDYE